MLGDGWGVTSVAFTTTPVTVKVTLATFDLMLPRVMAHSPEVVTQLPEPLAPRSPPEAVAVLQVLGRQSLAWMAEPPSCGAGSPPGEARRERH